MKPLGKAIRKGHLEGRPWCQESSKFLLAYRSTPHSTTKIPPAQRLYNREIRGKLPSLPQNSKVIDRHDEAKQNDEQQKFYVYADMRRKTRPSNINFGDTALVKRKKTNKFSTNFSPIWYTVVRVKGSKIWLEVVHIISHEMRPFSNGSREKRRRKKMNLSLIKQNEHHCHHSNNKKWPNLEDLHETKHKHSIMDIQ